MFWHPRVRAEFAQSPLFLRLSLLSTTNAVSAHGQHKLAILGFTAKTPLAPPPSPKALILLGDPVTSGFYRALPVTANIYGALHALQQL